MELARNSSSSASYTDALTDALSQNHPPTAHEQTVPSSTTLLCINLKVSPQLWRRQQEVQTREGARAHLRRYQSPYGRRSFYRGGGADLLRIGAKDTERQDKRPS